MLARIWGFLRILSPHTNILQTRTSCVNMDPSGIADLSSGWGDGGAVMTADPDLHSETELAQALDTMQSSSRTRGFDQLQPAALDCMPSPSQSNILLGKAQERTYRLLEGGGALGEMKSSHNQVPVLAYRSGYKQHSWSNGNRKLEH
ncbi:hypothetical protein AXG93_960s1400 [Marchantia polymorpha subsp. ruderalis]|uniref:Uncharacterized protein n=1 Tax=Marchantia polymorpha subsp. ruderalis TaxID=1480154 RepID=A0A176VGS8_MARPO|nr:hypothetical protein AXG93_960s1400 [Marchantia polymorpha subsp. ruderalis]